MDGLFPRSQQIHYGEQKADPAYAIGATDGCEKAVLAGGTLLPAGI